LWLGLTLALGMAFLAGQAFAWHAARSGPFLATSPNSSFFYVLTVLHALHVLGGLFGLVYTIRRTASAAWRVQPSMRPRFTGIFLPPCGYISCWYCARDFNQSVEAL